MAAIQDILGWRNISESVVKVETGIPDRLPAAFSTVKEDVSGDLTTWVTLRGQRQLARRGEYASPSRAASMRPIGEESARCLHFPEHIEVRHELQMRLRQHNDLLAQKMLKEELARWGVDHRTKFDNTRVALKGLMLSKGKAYFDSTGYPVATDPGATGFTVDYAIPAVNKNQVNGIINVSWDDPDAPIIQHLENIRVANIRATGRVPKHAFYGKNIPNYLLQNTTLGKYWAFNTEILKKFHANPQSVPDGFAGLEWHPMADAFFDDANDTPVAYWDDDQVTLTPEINKNVYTLYEGSILAPVRGAPTIEADLLGGVTNFQEVFGMGGYAVPQVDPVGLKLVMFDTFIPVWKNGYDMFIIDTVF